MKNIHILPTDKPSRLSILGSGKLDFGPEFISSSNSKAQHIYITSDEEIKERRLRFIMDNRERMCGLIHQVSVVLDSKICPEIILTTDQDLIKYGVQAIDDEFLEWFVKNPSCEQVEVQNDYLLWKNSEKEKLSDCYKIIIPKEEPMKQTALDFLSEKYMYVTWLRNRDEISAEQADKMRAQYLAESKEIEKEQSIDFARLCLNKAKDLDVLTAFINAQKYYNETYRKDG
jgi:murein DD-endopeptidase MepM/ murein hydrolase activator NlpD